MRPVGSDGERHRDRREAPPSTAPRARSLRKRGGPQKRRDSQEEREGTMTNSEKTALSRRTFVKGSALAGLGALSLIHI